jgi:ATP-binding cassette subfamily F protein uup
VLENFLLEFQGCLIIVSHDRYFMDRLVDHLFVFEGSGVVSDFPGNYSQLREWQKQKEPVEQEEKKPEPQKQKEEPAVKRKLSYKEQREFELLEKEIAALEKEKELVSEKLGSAGLPFDQLQQLSARIGELSTLIDAKELRWLELSENAT